MRILQNFILSHATKIIPSPVSLAPLNSSNVQIRWKRKPANTAQTRLQDRTRDPRLDHLTKNFIRLNRIINLHSLISSRKRGPFVSVQFLSRLSPHVGLNAVPIGVFLRKYPHIFEVFSHPVKRTPCSKFTPTFLGLLKEENDVICGLEIESVTRITKILLMSINGSIHMHALRLTRKELGLPENFRESIILKYDNIFRLIDLEIVEIVDRDIKQINDDKSLLGVAEVEKWREIEYRERWLSEFEVKYAFPMNFPTGFKKEAGFKEKLRNWQRLNYVKPYEKIEAVRVRTCGGFERYEKRAVGIIHELLCLTVEKMLEVQHLTHFRKDLGIEVNIRELLLKYPGIFYLSIKGNTQIVFLREAYTNGCLIEANPIYAIRKKVLDLILFGSRSTKKLRAENKTSGEGCDAAVIENEIQTSEGGFVIPILESYLDSRHDENPHQDIDYQRNSERSKR
ncbi:hypothetical protein M9H77_29578 [Catharanthus roseus]|uniref:Uncharacterized protein n=1 Tax=Catharanthus roseus TaxID=4058 RepID=A0ACB9ZV65_CATRO|nr:hypothetical protein M9H77_29578 [Catharanthus roseus]